MLPPNSRGSMDEIRAGVRRYLDAGIDTAFLQLQSSEPDPAKRREILRAATRALAPGFRRGLAGLANPYPPQE